MSMRGFIGSAVVATLMAGCGVGGQIATNGDDSTQDPFKVRCPDPSTDCTVSNGAGIYTEEKGFAGIGAPGYMITHFVNQPGGGVNLTVRYFDSAAGIWVVSNNASVYYANYGTKTHLTVLSVRESNTVPVWTIYDPSTSSNITVGDGGLLNLQVVVVIDKLYTLDWDAVMTDTIKASIRKYNMRWRLTGAATATQYCYRADASKDEVVFQMGMAVNPGNAMVTRDATTAETVTLSCRYGAPATVRMWGYPYRAPANTFYFDAGLHMKRASYCGDGSYYTKSGTNIRIWDNAGIESDPMTAAEVEAWWTPAGAKCIGPMRHWAMGFTGMCNGVPLPDCSTIATGALADAASPSAP